jgi:hypothetical protein
LIDFGLTALVIAAALIASTVAAVAGFGGAVIMLPILVHTFGVREAIPILTVVQLVGNLSRVWFNRRELALPVVGWFAIGAVPLSLLGAVVFARAPAPLLHQLLGVFLLLMVVYRHTTVGRNTRIGLRGFLGIGAIFGFLSAILGSVGPIMAPFFLAYGLIKGAYIGTEALATSVMHGVKLVGYGGYALLSGTGAAIGLLIGLVMIAGSFAGKRLLDRLPDRVFPWIIEAVLVISGLQFLLFPG